MPALTAPVSPSVTRSIAHGLKSIGAGAVWATVGTVFNQGSTLASNIWIANLLGKTRFGEFAIVLATVQAAASLASLGIGYTTTRYVSEWRHRDLKRAGELLGLFSRVSWLSAVVAALLLAAASSGLASDALKAPALGPSLLIAAITTVFTVRNGYLTGALYGLEAFRSIGINGIVSGTGYLALTVLGGVWGGVRGAAWGLLASAVLQCASLSIALHFARVKAAIQKGAATFADESELLIRFAVPAALSGLSTVPVLWAVQAILARSPQGYDNLAVYAAGLNLLAMVLFAPAVLNGVAMAWINRTHVLDGDTAYRHAMRANVYTNAAIVCVALVATVAIGPLLLGLYGRDFRTGYAALALLLIAALPETLTNALYQSIQRRQRIWQGLLAI
ncbi:MAG: oligosaccharide flippase family protein, partial [Gemmatimonadaceae bacterium]